MWRGGSHQSISISICININISILYSISFVELDISSISISFVESGGKAIKVLSACHRIKEKSAQSIIQIQSTGDHHNTNPHPIQIIIKSRKIQISKWFPNPISTYIAKKIYTHFWFLILLSFKLLMLKNYDQYNFIPR